MYDLKLLFAEDNIQNRQSYVLGLRQLFTEVIEANNGEEAFNLYRQHEPDILLTDINMPLLDGLELIRIIRAENPDIKIIVLSAHTDQDKLMKAIPLGLSSYLVKPITRDVLKKSLKEVSETIDKNELITLPNGYIFDKKSHQLHSNNLHVDLTNKENIVINTLLKISSRSVSYEQLAIEIWGEYEISNYNNIQGIVSRLRKKAPNLIESVYGYGYRLKI